MTYVLDTETTGLGNHPTFGHPQVIELAYIKLPTLRDIEGFLNNHTDYIKYTERFKPSISIHKQASEIHGIYFKDVLKCRKSEDIQLPSMEYMVGHNIQYDHRCLGKPNVKLICTQQLAKKIDKHFGVGFPNVKLEGLVSYFNPSYNHGNYHKALEDCAKTIYVLFSLLKFIPGITTWDELYEFQVTLKGKKNGK